jgi:N-acetylmuramoyl-L-alanine amidase
MILQATYPQNKFSITNNFFYSPIKRRLTMLTKNNNTKISYISRILVLPVALFLLAAFTLKNNQSGNLYSGKEVTVIIDAGHGGTDNGAVVNGMNEKDINLSIAKEIKELNTNSNIKIILTRETDLNQSPKQKADFANTNHADLLVSIHVNAAQTNSTDRGLNIYVSKDEYPNSEKSKVFASAVLNEFMNHYGIPVIKNPMQLKQGVWILQNTSCPAILIEAGYLTDPKDFAYLQTAAAKKTIATNILSGINNYLIHGNEVSSLTNIAPTSNNNTIQQDSTPIKGHPLIIVDGISKEKEFKIESIDEKNIESVNVLKGKNATDKYGLKAKDGAIEIKTKKNN